MIEELNENIKKIIVFESDIRGVGEGLRGNFYAFPTLNKDMERYSMINLVSIKDAFYRSANAHPEYTFLLTKVGCDIAGYPEEDMCLLFQDAPENVVLPEDWRVR